MSRSEIFSLRNFQGCCLLFSYQGSLLFSCFSRVSFDIISCSFLFVKPFFNFFQQLFSFMILNGEGGIWTLAPLLTTYSLSRGAPSASLGTSPRCSIFQNRIVFFSGNKRRGWDSNPCALSDKRFSRPPRYDHFDTSPHSDFCTAFAWRRLVL